MHDFNYKNFINGLGEKNQFCYFKYLQVHKVITKINFNMGFDRRKC